MQSTSKQEFDIIYSQAEHLFKAFPEYQFKTITALIIIIGWLLTAQTAQTFIKANAAVALPATAIAFGILVVFKVIWIKAHIHKINVCYQRLKVLADKNGFTHECIDIFDVSPLLPYTYYIINTLVSGAVFVTVYLICT